MKIKIPTALIKKSLPVAKVAFTYVGTALVCNVASKIIPEMLDTFLDWWEGTYERAYRLEKKEALRRAARRKAASDIENEESMQAGV